MNKLYTVNEAADYLSVSPWQVRHYIRKGYLHAYRLGDKSVTSKGHWRIPEESLQDYLKR